jgi:hypothetical protein
MAPGLAVVPHERRKRCGGLAAVRHAIVSGIASMSRARASLLSNSRGCRSATSLRGDDPERLKLGPWQRLVPRRPTP